MDDKHFKAPIYALISGRPLRHISDPHTGWGLWQKYDYATGEFVEDIEFVRSVILLGVDPTDDEFNFSGDIDQVTKSEFDRRVSCAYHNNAAAALLTNSSPSRM